ncbi:hypothetical protein [Caulobacter soli]|uniref:hypothetical protein n=1 Tax=Caulobacter soli TaxID=2708539 RepID=UPI0013EA965E|nr:hypothetical protein [Caulobacter soli]
MNGVSLKQQDVVARAARKAGGYWKLVQKFVDQPAPTRDNKVQMALERDAESGELRVVRVTKAA